MPVKVKITKMDKTQYFGEAAQPDPNSTGASDAAFGIDQFQTCLAQDLVNVKVEQRNILEETNFLTDTISKNKFEPIKKNQQSVTEKQKFRKESDQSLAIGENCENKED